MVFSKHPSAVGSSAQSGPLGDEGPLSVDEVHPGSRRRKEIETAKMVRLCTFRAGGAD